MSCEFLLGQRHQHFPGKVLLLLIPFMFGICSSYSAHAETVEIRAAHCMPYIGEHLEFDVNWEFINAGSASMDVLPKSGGWQVNTVAKTNKALDIFRKVRDYITAEGLCVNGRMQSTLFDANLHERKYVAKKRTEFLWQENRVRHSQNKVVEDFDVPAGHLSVIDAFFAVRNLKLIPGQKLKVPVFDSRKRYEIEVTVLPEREVLTAPWGKKVECIVVRPLLKSEGIFTNKGEMTLWLSNDERHIPIKVAAKIKFGSIFAHLTSYQYTAPTKSSTIRENSK
ncbi:Protein of unknown function (DUF3108) [Mariprofundus ferrinatatus]|uniref:DUF3108 domain-containing protein n=1 Tax=Mariprofundus ferrinatatus TaxID=1921087 RepID=A0A2K8LCM8_9PROT|nr:DUF3108 domain-containing protein [Mariprofundus ferrinatatus]ATX82046.1 Protein of unknown function (DUF3108) [Mariprofundus ferrinatatus]